VQFQVVEDITERVIACRFSKFQVTEIHGKARPDIVIFTGVSAEMNCLIMADAHGFKNIQNIV
jgi:hypothetical protein